ncbi:hypothetical protein NDU88_003447 [Pleurodeles waltl]|uniref:Uncharacterized protein n=1 Tax=Pleurodeles waltl TaxID=8319 RepID=A0AAV7WPF5_PLEWA|nr:hypothetical protein NDU88_003447 [Pleurodeles waltl]
MDIRLCCFLCHMCGDPTATVDVGGSAALTWSERFSQDGLPGEYRGILSAMCTDGREPYDAHEHCSVGRLPAFRFKEKEKALVVIGMANLLRSVLGEY